MNPTTFTSTVARRVCNADINHVIDVDTDGMGNKILTSIDVRVVVGPSIDDDGQEGVSWAVYVDGEYVTSDGVSTLDEHDLSEALRLISQELYR